MVKVIIKRTAHDARERDYLVDAARALHQEMVKANAAKLRDELLPNWARWWIQDHIKPQDAATGYGRPSLAAIIMQSAAVQIKTGYYDPPPPEINYEQALMMHELIKRLSYTAQSELYRYYTTQWQTDEPAQRKARQRAIDSLAAMLIH